MIVNEYVHLFRVDDGTNSTIPLSAGASLIGTSNGSGAERALVDGLTKKAVEDTVSRAVISPLNSATGGLASPVYSITKTIAQGGGAAAIGGGVATLAIAGVMLAVSKIEQRVAKMESRAEQANNRDNALIRAGAKAYATNYKGSFSGVRSTDVKRG